MRRPQFQAFLVTRYRGPVSGEPLSVRSSLSYGSKVGRVEDRLGVNVDDEDLTEGGIAALMTRLAATKRMPKSALNDCRSALRAYAQFAD